MICPECDGSGRVRTRFLFFFTRHAECPNCLGTGEYPPPRGRDAVRYRLRDRDDDPDRWAAGSLGLASATRPTDDRFEVGSGGRSGGGGASASWGDSPGDNAPVIADPFASEPSAVTDAAVIDAADSSSADAGSDSSDSADGGSDSGTSY
jgi:hypothetical protein